jgi:hypothetical protein
MISAELIQWTPSLLVWIKRYLESSQLHYCKELKLSHSTHLYKFYQEAENYNLFSSFDRLYHTWIKSLSLFLATTKFQELINESKTPLTWTVQTHCVCITIPFVCQFGCQEKPNPTVQDSRLLFHCSNQHHLMQKAWMYKGIASNYPMVSQMTTVK